MKQQQILMAQQQKQIAIQQQQQELQYEEFIKQQLKLETEKMEKEKGIENIKIQQQLTAEQISAQKLNLVIFNNSKFIFLIYDFYNNWILYIRSYFLNYEINIKKNFYQIIIIFY